MHLAQDFEQYAPDKEIINNELIGNDLANKRRKVSSVEFKMSDLDSLQNDVLDSQDLDHSYQENNLRALADE